VSGYSLSELTRLNGVLDEQLQWKAGGYKPIGTRPGILLSGDRCTKFVAFRKSTSSCLGSYKGELVRRRP